MTCNSQASNTSVATVAEYNAYILSVDGMEQRVMDDNLYPRVRNNKCKALCFIISELTKECIRYFKFSRYNNNAKEKQKTNTD